VANPTREAAPASRRPDGRRRKVLVVEGASRKAVAAVRSLGRAGFEVHVTSRSLLAPAAGSRFCARSFRHPALAGDGRGFWAAMTRLLAREAYDVVLPMEGDDLEFFSRRRGELPAGTAFPFAPDEVLARAADKHEVMRLAASLGIPAPASELPAGPADLPAIAARIGFPAILKPCRGQGSHGVKRVDDLASLVEWHERIVARFGPALVQEYVPAGGGEFGVSLLMDRGSRTVARFSHRRLRSYPVAGGPSTLREGIRDPAMERDAERLLQALGWYGVAMVEFRGDPRDGRPRLMEINHRFWGSLQLAVVSGVDFPALLCRLALGEPVAPVLEHPVGVQCRWLFPGDVMHFLSNPDRMRLEPGFFRFSGPELHYDVESWSDPGPALRTVAGTLAQALRPANWRKVTRRESH
jgi:predicted ATP-grasp superfamily ATP-dependent carboligase